MSRLLRLLFHVYAARLGRRGVAHDCSCGLQLKVVESMKEKRRLLPA